MEEVVTERAGFLPTVVGALTFRDEVYRAAAEQPQPVRRDLDARRWSPGAQGSLVLALRNDQGADRRTEPTARERGESGCRFAQSRSTSPVKREPAFSQYGECNTVLEIRAENGQQSQGQVPGHE